MTVITGLATNVKSLPSLKIIIELGILLLWINSGTTLQAQRGECCPGMDFSPVSK